MRKLKQDIDKFFEESAASERQTMEDFKYVDAETSRDASALGLDAESDANSRNLKHDHKSSRVK